MKVRLEPTNVLRKPTIRDLGHVGIANMVILSVFLGRPSVVVSIHAIGLIIAYILYTRIVYPCREIAPGSHEKPI